VNSKGQKTDRIFKLAMEKTSSSVTQFQSKNGDTTAEGGFSERTEKNTQSKAVKFSCALLQVSFG
jgi:hypothetical protein